MDHAILSESFTRIQAQVDSHLDALYDFLKDFGAKAPAQIISQLRKSLQSPFLFVVVGEVKSGKSSFINALLGEEICAVDAAPCTDVIQQIVFSQERFEVDAGPFLRRVGLPLEILKSVAIVDTPGTNTVIENHQEITRNFIPNSDLVILVFPAKNPYTQTAWDLVDYIQEEWRRKIVVVLQQADLARSDELETNVAKVGELAAGKGIPDPMVFVTSAEREFSGAPDSGFEPVRAYIRSTVTGGRQYRLKVESILEATGQVLVQVRQSLEERRTALAEDRKTVEGVRARLAAGHKQSAYELQGLIHRVGDRYRKTTQEIKAELREGFSFSNVLQMSFASLFSRKRSIQSWLRDLQGALEARLREDFNHIAEEGAEHFAEGVSQLLRSLTATLDPDHGPGFSSDAIFDRLGQRRVEVIQTVRERIADLDGKETLLKTLQHDPDSLAPSLMGGGVLTAVGAVILAVTHSIFFDITGGLLTGAGLFMAGGVLFVRKGKIIQQFEAGLDKGGETLEQELNERLSAKLDMVYDDIDRGFLPLYDYVEQEEKRLSPLTDRFEAIEREHRGVVDRMRAELPAR